MTPVPNLERRYQVFVSSTSMDLVEERREIIQALLEMDCLPAGMEMFPAADEDQWSLIKGVIDESDYYVVVVGGRYGSTTPEGVSYTEKEYDYAVAAGIPVLGFVHANPDDISKGKSDMNPEAADKLELFRAKVRSRMVKPYGSPAELGSVVSRGLMRAIKQDPREGWVRGRFAMTSEIRAEIAELRAALADQKRVVAEEAVNTPSSELNTEYNHGDDTVELVISANWFYMANRSETWKFTYTWDSVIDLLGPLMIDEATEEFLRRTLAVELWEAVKRLDSQMSDVHNLSFEVADSSWGMVIVQLRALGAIETSKKAHGVANKFVYWTLTPAGDQYLVGLRAQRRSTPDDSTPAI
jgi:Domain of unknown function (DUF4062)